MNNNRINALHIGATALIALAVLQLVWHAWLVPATSAQFWPTLALAIVPLLPGLWVCLRNVRRGVLIGGIVCLFYFCHGVSLAYGDPGERFFAFAEIVFSLVVVGALGWDARHYRRNRANSGKK
jgi:uncharacterized membrane protein